MPDGGRYELKPYPEYKDSGLPWLGRIPAHWDEKRAKYYFREVDERSTTGAEQLMSVSHVTGVTPRKQNVTMFMAESNVGHKVCRPGDLVINTMWAWMAALGVARQSGLVSPSYGVYRPRNPPAYVPDYVDHLLRTQPYASEYLCRSTGIRASRLRLYPDDFLDIRIVRPPPEEQEVMVRFIAHHNRLVHNFIRNRRRLIELLIEQKQAIINRAVTRGLDPNVPLKPSGIDWLGAIPKYWTTRRFRHVVRSPIKNGVGESAQGFRSDWPRYIRITDIAGPTRLRDDTLASLPPDIAVDAVVQPGDLLFAAVGATFGKVYYHKHAASDCCFAGYLVRVAPNDSLRGDFLCYWAQSRVYWDQVRSQVIQATIQNFSASRYKDLWLTVPPLAEQEAIVRHLDCELVGVEKAIANAERSIGLIRAYRTRLIVEVVTGKVDVRHLAPQVEEVQPEDLEPLDGAEEIIEDERQDPDVAELVEDSSDD